MAMNEWKNICCGSKFYLWFEFFKPGLSFSNCFEIFKPVPLSTVWKRAFPFLGCGWKIGAWLFGGFLKRIRAYQKIPVFFASHQPPLPPCSVISLLNLGLLNPSYYFSPNPTYYLTIIFLYICWYSPGFELPALGSAVAFLIHLSTRAIITNSPLFLSHIITHSSQAPLGQNCNLFILHILNTSAHAHFYQVKAWQTSTKLPIVFLKKCLKPKLKAEKSL